MTILRKTVTIAGSNWLTVLISLLTGINIIRYLGAVGRGEIVLFVSWCAIIAFLLNFGLPASAAFHNAARKYSVKTILTSYLALTPLLFLILYLAFKILYGTYSDHLNFGLSTDDSLLLILVCVPSIWFQNISQSLLLTSGCANVVAALNVSRALATALSTAVLLEYYLADPQEIIFLIVLIEFCFGLTAGAIALNKSGPLDYPRIFDCQLSLLRYGIKSYPSAALPNTQSHYSNILVGNVLGLESAAFFALAGSFYGVATSIVKPISSLLLGEVGNPQYPDPVVRIRKVSTTVVYWSLLALPVLHGAGWILIPTIYGPDFTVVLPVLFVLLMAAAIVNGQAILQVKFLIDGKPEIQSYLCLGGSAFLIISLPEVIPYFGMVGAAYAILITRITLYAATIIIIAKEANTKWRKFVSPVSFYLETEAIIKTRILTKRER